MNGTTKAQVSTMNKRLREFGLSEKDIRVIRGISRGLTYWDEALCGTEDYTIEQKEDGTFWKTVYKTGWHFPVEDYSMRAVKRLDKLFAKHPDLTWYHQTDSRGCALYVLKKADIEGKDIDQVYSSYGRAVYW